MIEPIGTANRERLRRLPWTGPEGTAEYAAPGEADLIADRTEAHIVSMARNDAAYALSMVERSDLSNDELRSLVGKLAGALNDVASVAELRGERLAEPVHGPVVRALEEALRASFRPSL
ncbi:hypothetical protein [Streptomyces sp. NPDC058548]|uniref:hypothetical protein n=1 Tax=unclassified Streptomyces TaxID=2593676 RepID=UPI003666AAEB